MADKLKVTVVTPTQQVVRAEADMVLAPAVLGQVGILPNHRPLLADLGTGPVELRDGAQVHRYNITGGFLEVNANAVLVLAESAEPA